MVVQGSKAHLAEVSFLFHADEWGKKSEAQRPLILPWGRKGHTGLLPLSIGKGYPCGSFWIQKRLGDIVHCQEAISQ